MKPIPLMRSYNDFYEQATAYLQDNLDQAFAVMYIDINGFQTVNQFYGFTEGDRLLAAFQGMLCSTLQVCMCANILSDHFLCLLQLEDTTQLDKSLEVYSSQFHTFIQQQADHHANCRLSIAGGICLIQNENIIKAIDGANLARKSAKMEKKTRLVWYSKQMENEIDGRKQLEQEIFAALNAQAFTFYLQPKVNVETGKIIGAEALVRWIKNDGSMVYPDAFIPIMEENGTIRELDLLVLRKVCAEMRQRILKHKKIVNISVNLSRVHIDLPNEAAYIHSIVQEYHLPAYLLEFELTETILMKQMQGAKQLVDELRGYGYQVSIDDFGSGYAGINIWQELNADVIKLDKNFLSTDPVVKARNEILLPEIIAVSHKLQIFVICEGVETREQCQYVQSLGATGVQGYYFAKPLPSEAFAVILEQNDFAERLPMKAKPRAKEDDEVTERRARAMAQAILHISPAGIIGAEEATGKLLFCTESMSDICGYSRQELLQAGDDWQTLLFRKIIFHAEDFDEQGQLHSEGGIYGKNGDLRWVRIDCGHATSVEWGAYILCSFYDITLWREAQSREDAVQNERKQLTKFYARAFENIPCAIIQATLPDPQTQQLFILQANDEAWALIGEQYRYYEKPQLAVSNVFPEEREQMRQMLLSMKKTGDSKQYHCRIVDNENKVRCLRGKIQVVADLDSRPVILMSLLDVTAEKLPPTAPEALETDEEPSVMPSGQAQPHGSKKTLLAGVLLCLLCAALIIGNYYAAMLQDFAQMQQQAIARYTKTQITRITEDIEAQLTLLDTIATTMAQAHQGEPDTQRLERWVAAYIQALNGDRDAQYAYHPMTYYEEQIALGKDDENVQIYAQLKQGKTIVTDIHYSNRYGKQYFYGIAKPILVGGQVTGVIQVALPAEGLTSAEVLYHDFYIYACMLVNTEGEIIPTTGQQDGNLLTLMQQDNCTQEDITKLQQMLRANTNEAQVLSLQQKHMVHIALASLPYHDWHYVVIARPELFAQPTTALLLKSVLGLLAAVMLGISTTVLIFFLRKQKKQQAHTFWTLAKMSDTIMFEYNYQTDCMTFTPNIKKIYQAHATSIKNYTSYKDEWFMYPEDRAKVAELIKQVPLGTQSRTAEIRLLNLKNKYVWCALQVNYIWTNQKPAYMIGKIVNIEMQKACQMQLQRATQQDALTSLLNVRAMKEQVQQALDSTAQGCFMMLDIDNFKQINDSQGHSTGNQALLEVSRILRDILPSDAILGRLGGDEFAIFMPDVTRTTEAQGYAEQILQNLQQSHGLSISMSIGIALYTKGEAYASLLHRADTAMYEAKNSGKAQYAVADNNT